MAEQASSKLATLAELAEPLTCALTHSAESWAKFLDSAAKMYKYAFDDQL